MPTVQLYDNNHTGLDANIVFSAFTGGSYSLGIQTIPYVFVSDYPYGYYDLTYSQWNQVCFLFIIPPILFLKLDTTYGLGANFVFYGNNIFDMTINWGDGNTTTYNGSSNYNPIYTYTTPNTEYNVTIEFNDNSIINYISTTSVNCTSIDNLKILTNLSNLSLNFNKLTTLDITNNSLINTLSLISNQLTTLDLSNNQYISNLDLSNNQLTTLNLTNFNFLNYVYLQNNQLLSTTIDDVLIGLSGNSLFSGQAYLYSQTPPACPTSLGRSAATTLQLTRGWQVQYDFTCPPYFEIIVDATINQFVGFYMESSSQITYLVDWGDGGSTGNITDYSISQSYYYSTPGIYSIKIYTTDYTNIYYMDLTNYGGFNITDINGLNLISNLNNLSASYNMIPTTNINHILIDLALTSITGGSAALDNQTPPACPTGGGLIALNHLVNDLSWGVTVDTGCP